MSPKTTARRVLALGLLLIAGLAAWVYAKDQQAKAEKHYYSPTRDMRKTAGITPQGMTLELPDSSVSTMGVEPVLPVDVAAATLKNPVAPDTASLRRGGQTYAIYCTPCHGPMMDGKGPVAAKYVPPPDLLAKMTRDRTDGYIYRYVRQGGAIMPKYGFALSSQRVWDVVNFVREMQRKSPR